jgi:hypothetical protein
MRIGGAGAPDNAGVRGGNVSAATEEIDEFRDIAMNHLVLLILCGLVSCPVVGYSQTFSTRFEGTENPLSEGGKWVHGGLDWARFQKDNGLAYGTQTGTNSGPARYDDSYAHLSGFPADQEAWGVAHITKPNASCHQEIEILLRWTSSAHRTTGYECFARCLHSGASYVQIVRWDGPLGKFTYLADKRGTNYGLKDGDVLKASIVGNVIRVCINGVEKARATDNTFKTGNPGIGHFLGCQGGQGVGSNGDFGFSSFTARGLGEGEGGSSLQLIPGAPPDSSAPQVKKKAASHRMYYHFLSNDGRRGL